MMLNIIIIIIIIIFIIIPEHAWRPHHAHGVAGPAVELAELVVRHGGVAQPALHPRHVVQLVLDLHRVLAVVEAPAEAGRGGEGVH